MDLPSSCPSPAPSWSGTISPVVAAKCQPCHSSGGQAGDRLLVDYPSVYQLRSTVLDQVYTCSMPPPDGGVLTGNERHELMDWLVCSAPNN